VTGFPDFSRLDFDAIDYLVPHQTSARAIRNGMKVLAARLGVEPKHVVQNVEEFGNTASTTHFVALHRYLEEGRLTPKDRILLLSFASGLEIGIVIFTIDQLAERYGNHH